MRKMRSIIAYLIIVLLFPRIQGEEHHETATNANASVTQMTTVHNDHTESRSTPTIAVVQFDADPCVENGKKSLQDNLGRSYPAFQNLTNNLTWPVNFYRNLFNQSFNESSFQAYCKAYIDGRVELDKCGNSTAKSVVFISLAPVDYVCSKKVNEYAQGIECMQKINNAVEATDCRQNCKTDEQASLNARNPPANATDKDKENFALGDCLYSKCMAQCRKTAIEKKCGQEKSELELEALKSVMTAVHSMSNATDMLKATATNIWQGVRVFPEQCRDLVNLPLRQFAGAGNNFLEAAINGTLNFYTVNTNAPNTFTMSSLKSEEHHGTATFMSKSAFTISLAIIMAKLLF